MAFGFVFVLETIVAVETVVLLFTAVGPVTDVLGLMEINGCKAER